MINNVTLVGRLTKDPELKYTPSGVALSRFTLAVNRTFSNQQGEKEADFINILVWRKQAENVANFLRKGSMAGVVGRIQTSNFEGQDGKRVYMTEVVAESVQFLSTPGESAPPNTNTYGNETGASNGPKTTESAPPKYQTGPTWGQEQPGPVEVNDDELPF